MDQGIAHDPFYFANYMANEMNPITAICGLISQRSPTSNYSGWPHDAEYMPTNGASAES